MSYLEMVKHACQFFATDPSSPSFVVSWLEERQEWYASFVRYGERFGRSKYTVTNARHVEFDVAVAQLVANVQAYIEGQVQIAPTPE